VLSRQHAGYERRLHRAGHGGVMVRSGRAPPWSRKRRSSGVC
jgi:hypothetical protein